MGLSRRAVLLGTLALVPPLARPAIGRPLWPGASHADTARLEAIGRGLEFLYRTASHRQHFADHGSDLLFCFFSLSRATADEAIKHRAWRMGEERARHWRRLHPRVPAGSSAADLVALAYGSLAADGFGHRDDRMKAALQRAAGRFGPVDFVTFDPRTANPPGDVPKQCTNCANDNPRGRARCRICGRTLTMRDPYDLLCDALVIAYTGDQYGAKLGASLSDVMHVVPRMRPYDDPATVNYERFSSICYAVTHVVYTLNDYGVFRLNPEWLPQEFDYLRTHLHRTIDAGDAELTGEFLDSLKSFGLTLADPIMQAGTEFVLSEQNSDGSWGDASAGDIYELYHPTWTAICGLMDYDWRGEGVTFPEALRQARAA